MKNIFKTYLHSNNRRIFIFSILASVLLFTCSDYLDINENPNSPTTAPLDQLLTNVEDNFNSISEFDIFLAEILSSYVHQFTSREEQDQYGTKPDNYAVKNTWDVAYSVLNETNIIINQGTSENEMIMVGMAQIIKAYTVTLMVDIFGDIPYTEAGLLDSGVISPVFDSQVEIYQDALSLIDEGLSNINSDTGSNPGSQDLFYSGNIGQWNRFVNTLKLKLYNQIKSTSLFDQAKVNALITSNNFMASGDDDFQFPYSTAQSPSDERNPLFTTSYLTGQATQYLSPWFYEILKGWNPNIHNGIEDPRIPYYFFNQLVPGQLPPDVGDPTTGDPKADYWDRNTGFHSIRFGSVGPDRDGSSRGSSTYPGIFICGGRYDDGMGGNANASAGTGAAPHILLSYHELLFTEAELIQSGIISGDARTKLEQAINASFKKVDMVVVNSSTNQNVPTLFGSIGANDFINDILNEFDVASNNKKMEIIMTQKWVATFGDPVDQYTDYRRTGYPILANPEGPSPEYQLDNQDDWPLDDSETVQNRPFQVSLFWPADELNVNPNAPSQKDATTYNIFWDN